MSASTSRNVGAISDLIPNLRVLSTSEHIRRLDIPSPAVIRKTTESTNQYIF